MFQKTLTWFVGAFHWTLATTQLFDRKIFFCFIIFITWNLSSNFFQIIRLKVTQFIVRVLFYKKFGQTKGSDRTVFIYYNSLWRTPWSIAHLRCQLNFWIVKWKRKIKIDSKIVITSTFFKTYRYNLPRFAINGLFFVFHNEN